MCAMEGDRWQCGRLWEYVEYCVVISIWKWLLQKSLYSDTSSDIKAAIQPKQSYLKAASENCAIHWTKCQSYQLSTSTCKMFSLLAFCTVLNGSTDLWSKLIRGSLIFGRLYASIYGSAFSPRTYRSHIGLSYNVIHITLTATTKVYGQTASMFCATKVINTEPTQLAQEQSLKSHSTTSDRLKICLAFMNVWLMAHSAHGDCSVTVNWIHNWYIINNAVELTHKAHVKIHRRDMYCSVCVHGDNLKHQKTNKQYINLNVLKGKLLDSD